MTTTSKTGLLAPTARPPYADDQFRLKSAGKYVAGATTVGPFRRVTEIVTHNEGGSGERKIPGRTDYPVITFDRVETTDRDFNSWSAGEIPGTAKDLELEVYNRAGKLEVTYTLYRCWASEYEVLASFDLAVDGFAIEQPTLVYKGWSRASPPK